MAAPIMISSAPVSAASPQPQPQHQPQPPSPITTIPLEVLLRISYYLETNHLCKLRLTCHAVEQSLYNTFTAEFFTRKQFMVTHDSLQALIDISKSRLGQHLQYVHFGLECFPEGMSRPVADAEKECQFRQRYADQFALWNTGHHIEMLTEAFRNLENLQGLIIRDFNSRRRTRDGPMAEWTSYGANTAFAATGVRLGSMGAGWNSTFPSHYCSQVFYTLLFAASKALKSSGVSPKGVEIMCKNGNQLRDFAFNIPSFLEEDFIPVLNGLEKLHLSIDLTWRSAVAPPSWAVSSTPRASLDFQIRKFLGHCTNLKDLRINERHSYDRSVYDLLAWLSSPEVEPLVQIPHSILPPPTPQSPPTVNLPHLEELSLGIMDIDPSLLVKVVAKFASSLKRLEFLKISLKKPFNPNHDIRDDPERPVMLWGTVFERLQQIPNLDLHHVKFAYLQQGYPSGMRSMQIYFDGIGPDVSYTGPDWKHYLQEITPLLQANLPRDYMNFTATGIDPEDEEDIEYSEDDESDVEISDGDAQED